MTTIQQLPKSWNEITLYQYQELNNLELEADNFGNFQYILEQLAILLDTDSEDELFEDMDIDELLNIIKNIKWLRSKPANNIVKKINNMFCKDINKLTLGEFLDLEFYFKENYINNLQYIAAIFYRSNKQDEWGHTIIEPYEYDLEERSKLFIDLNITKLYGLIDYYLEWKSNIMEIYANVFEDPNFDKIENEEELDAKELADIKKEIEEDKKKAEWGWESVIYDLSNKDLTKYNDLFNTPFILVMNTLSMKKTFNV